jgi:hypothetical protein
LQPAVAVAMNLLRLIGQNTLNEPDAPVRHAAKRRRIKTVMQELMFKAARMIRHAGCWVLGLGESDRGFAVFERHYGQLSTEHWAAERRVAAWHQNH